MSQQQSVKNREEKKSFPYLKVVKSIITSPKLTASDIRTYLVIASHYNSVTGLTFPSYNSERGRTPHSDDTQVPEEAKRTWLDSMES